MLYKSTRLRNAREAFQSDSGIVTNVENLQEEKVKRVLLALVSKPPTPPHSLIQEGGQTSSEALINPIPFIEKI